MPLSATDIQRYEQENTSGFNYKLPDGTIIRTTAPNPQNAATVDTIGILAGQIASPISKNLLELARLQQKDLTGSSEVAKFTGQGGGALQSMITPGAPDTSPAQNAPDPTSAAGAARLSQLAGQPLYQGPNNPTATYSAQSVNQGAPAPIPPVQNVPSALPSQPTTPTLPASTYTGSSVVDYLNSVGQPTDFASRARLAQSLGMQNYTGTAQQNTTLLNTLRSRGSAQGGVNTTGLTPEQAAGVQAAQESLANLQRLRESGFDPNQQLPSGTDIRDLASSGESKQFQGEQALALFRDMGIDIDPDAFASNPQSSLRTLVQDVMSALNLPDISSQLNEINGELKVIDDAYADKVADINDNPWISEAQRSREITKEQERYEMKRGGLVNRLNLLQDAYDSARQQAQFAATTAINLYTNERNFEQDRLDAEMLRAERRLESERRAAEFDTQIVEVYENGIPRKRLINSQTGEVIADLGRGEIKATAGTARTTTGFGVGGASMLPTAQQVPLDTLDDIRNAPVSPITKAVMAGYMKGKDLTPTDKAQVFSEMYEIGFNPQSYIISKLNNLIPLYEQISDGYKGAEAFFQPNFIVRNLDENVAEFESAREILTREIARLNDVGVLSDQDVAAYTNAMPSRTAATVDINRAKIRGLTASITGQSETTSPTGASSSSSSSGQTSSGIKWTVTQ